MASISSESSNLGVVGIPWIWCQEKEQSWTEHPLNSVVGSTSSDIQTEFALLSHPSFLIKVRQNWRSFMQLFHSNSSFLPSQKTYNIIIKSICSTWSWAPPFTYTTQKWRIKQCAPTFLEIPHYLVTSNLPNSCPSLTLSFIWICLLPVLSCSLLVQAPVTLYKLLASLKAFFLPLSLFSTTLVQWRTPITASLWSVHQQWHWPHQADRDIQRCNTYKGHRALPDTKEAQC